MSSLGQVSSISTVEHFRMFMFFRNLDFIKLSEKTLESLFQK